MWNLNDPRASHPPHAAANTAVTAATADLYVAISGENIETKLDALSYHYSQVLTLIPLMPMRFLRFPTPSLLQGPANVLQASSTIVVSHARLSSLCTYTTTAT